MGVTKTTAKHCKYALGSREGAILAIQISPHPTANVHAKQLVELRFLVFLQVVPNLVLSLLDWFQIGQHQFQAVICD